MLMRISQWGLVVFIASVATAFLWPYLSPPPKHALDALWSTTQPRVLTFAQRTVSEQWQIVPLPLYRRAIIAPSEISLAWPARDDTGYMIERTRVDATERNIIREYYSRQDDGDYLVGWQINGIVAPPFTPPILVRPTQLQSATTWQSATVTGEVAAAGAGCVTLTLQGAPLDGWSEHYCDGTLQSYQHLPFDEHLTASIRLTQPTHIDATGIPRGFSAATLQRLGSLDILKLSNGPLGRLVFDEHQQQIIGSLLGGYLVAVDSNTGAERWRLIGDGEWYAQPVYDPFQALVVAADTSGQVYAIDGDGRIVWQYDHPEVVIADPCVTPAGIVIADTNGTIVLLDTNGRVVWHIDTQQPVRSTPLWDEVQRAVIVVAQSGRVQAFDLDGIALWTQGIDNAVQADPIMHDGIIYVVDDNGTLTALDSATGDLRWEFASHARQTWSATVNQNSVAIANEDEVWLVNARGEQIGNFQADSTAPPVFIGTDLITIGDADVRIWDTIARTYRAFTLDSIHQANDTDLEPLRVIQAAALSSQGLWWADAAGRVIALRTTNTPPLLPVRWQRNALEADIKTLAFEYATPANDSLLAISNRFNTLYYFNIKDGTLHQQVSLPGGRILAMAANHDTTHTLLLQSDGITAITAGTDHVRWKYPRADITGGTITAQANGDWVVWVRGGPSTAQLIRFNAQGGVVWQQAFDEVQMYATTFTGDFGFVDNTTAIDLRNGDILWQSALPLKAAFILDTTVCGFQDDGGIALRCLNRNDGSIDHITPTTLTTLPQQSIPSNDGAFVATPDHLVHWIDVQGTIRWQSRPEMIPIVHMQAYRDHAVVIRSDGRVQVFTATSSTPIAVVNDLPINYMNNVLPGWRSDFPIYADMLFVTSSNYVFGIDVSGVVHGK